jgi:hypothetical protein
MGVSWASAAIGETLRRNFHKVETKLLTTSPSQRQFQWGGGINDAGTMVWTTPANPSSPVWYVFAATWVPDSVLTVMQTPGLALEWPTNAGGYHVQYATNLLSPVVWQRFSGNQATNAGNFHQTIGPPVGSAAFFRLSTGSP